MSKKVIIILVEGVTEEDFLIDRLKELYSKYQIKFDIRNGDIFYDNKSSCNIKKLIGDTTNNIIKKNKYKPKDILAVVHISDTDGCMISDDNVIIDNKQEYATIYTPENIMVNSDIQKNNIISRNKKKSTNIKTMNSIDSIISKKYPYQVFYFSRNLEHVVFNEPNPSSETKYHNIDKFINELTIPIEEFLKTSFPPLSETTYCSKYNRSWSFISEGTNSLKRYTNVPLLFEFLNNKVKEK